MVDLKHSSRRWMRRLFGKPGDSGGARAGSPAVADGLSALLLIEEALADALVLGPVPSRFAPRSLGIEASGGETVQLWNRPVELLTARTARDAMARALGLALAGSRTAVLLSQEDLLGVSDLLGRAVARQLPLVVHAIGGADPALLPVSRTGDEGLQAAAATGAGVRYAATVQEAVDLAVSLRRAAEAALCPMVLAVDADTVAGSVQDFLLPDPGFLQAFVGVPDGSMHAASPSQELTFGRHRSRVPGRHDPQRPFLAGGLGGGREAALAAAGHAAYHGPHTATLLEEALAGFARETGRSHPATTSFRIDDAKVVLVAQAGFEEFLEAAVDRARSRDSVRVGLVALHALAPFPGEELAGLLRGKERIVVLEGTTAGLRSPGPLEARVRGCLDPGARSRVVSARTGAGLGALGGADVDALLRVPMDDARSVVLLGVSFSPAGGTDPKREVLYSNLRRHYPGAETLGIAGEPAAWIDPDPETFTLAVHRPAGHGGEALAGETARLLARLAGGHVRTSAAAGDDSWGRLCVDRLAHSPVSARDAGPDVRADVLWWVSDGVKPPASWSRGAKDGAVLLLSAVDGAPSVRDALPSETLDELGAKRLKLYLVRPAGEDTPAGGAGGSGEDDVREERRLGACLAVLAREGRIEASPRKILGARRELLGELEDSELERRLAAFQAGYDSVLAVETAGLARPGVLSAPEDPPVPAAVRRLHRADETVDSLPRFWDQTGVMYRRGDTGALTPDPYVATGVLPPLTAAFADHSQAASRLPTFDPALCTGCGACWSLCPDAALAPVALAPARLLERGMALAREAGRPAEALRMVASKLASAMTDVMTVSAEPPRTLDRLLNEAFQRVLKRTAVSEERKVALTDALGGLTAALGRLPVARTQPFFGAPEADAPGSGTLFSLVVQLEACKACGICVEACEPGALGLELRTESVTREASTVWNLVAELPATEEPVLTAAALRPEVGPVAAALLDRDANLAFGGGDGGEPGAGEKIALRQVLAVARRERMAVHRELLEDVAALRDRLAAEIRESMARALPVGDLDALQDGLRAMERPDVDLGELSRRMESAFDDGHVDVVRLRRLVEVAKELASLHWKLETGEGGLGLAPYSLLLGPGSPAAWAARYPSNPFGVPVTAAVEGETAGLARGLLIGEFRRAARDSGILRRARLELDDPQAAGRIAPSGTFPEPAEVRGGPVSPEAMRFVPPLFVVLSERAGDGAGLAELLAEGYPVVVLVLREDLLGLESVPGSAPGEGPSGEGWIEAAAAGSAAEGLRIAQTSLASPDHLARSVRDALARGGPTVLRLHAPSPGRHGFGRESTRERASLATASRAFPLFTLRIEAGTWRLDLDGNPAPEAPWSQTEAGTFLTPADWALGEARYRRYFRKVTPGGGDPVPLPAYLELAGEEREGKLPVVTDQDGTAWVVDSALVRSVEHRQWAWSQLQTAAAGRVGEASPSGLAAGESPPEAGEAAEVREAVEAAIASVRDQYDARLAEVRLDLAREVRGRLLTLLARHPAANGSGPETPGGE